MDRLQAILDNMLTFVNLAGIVSPINSVPKVNVRKQRLSLIMWDGEKYRADIMISGGFLGCGPGHVKHVSCPNHALITSSDLFPSSVYLFLSDCLGQQPPRDHPRLQISLTKN